MNSSMELMAELQEVYAKQYGLTIFLTDKNGELILPAKGENTLCNLLLGELLNRIKESLNNKWKISTPLLYDFFPGIYICAAPINGDSNFLLWTGVMVDAEQHSAVKRQIDSIGEQEDPERFLEQTPVLTQENKQEWVFKTRKLAQLMSLCIKESENSSFNEQMENFRNAIHMNKEEWLQLLSKILDRSREFDFLEWQNLSRKTYMRLQI